MAVPLARPHSLGTGGFAQGVVLDLSEKHGLPLRTRLTPAVMSSGKLVAFLGEALL